MRQRREARHCYEQSLACAVSHLPVRFTAVLLVTADDATSFMHPTTHNDSCKRKMSSNTHSTVQAIAGLLAHILTWFIQERVDQKASLCCVMGSAWDAVRRGVCGIRR